MKTILIVEDKHSGETLSTWIHLGEEHILKAHTLADARNLLMQNEVDVILLEDKLSDGSGYDCLIQLKSTPHIAQIPIVFVVGEEHGPLDFERAQDGGAEAVMFKALAKEELNDKIEGALKCVSDGLSGFPDISVEDLVTDADADSLDIYCDGDVETPSPIENSNTYDKIDASIMELPDFAILGGIEDEQLTPESLNPLPLDEDLSTPKDSEIDGEKNDGLSQEIDEKQGVSPLSLNLSVTSVEVEDLVKEQIKPVITLSPESYLDTALALQKHDTDFPLNEELQAEEQDDVELLALPNPVKEEDREKAQRTSMAFAFGKTVQAQENALLVPDKYQTAEPILATPKPLPKHGFISSLGGVVQAVELPPTPDPTKEEKKLERSSMAFSFGRIVQAQGKEPLIPVKAQTPESLLATAKPLHKQSFSLPLGRILQTGNRKTIEIDPILELVRAKETAVAVQGLELTHQDVVEPHIPLDSLETTTVDRKQTSLIVGNLDENAIKDEMSRMTRAFLPEILDGVLKKLILSEIAPQIHLWIDKRVETVMLETVVPQMKTWLNVRVSELVASHLNKDDKA